MIVVLAVGANDGKRETVHDTDDEGIGCFPGLHVRG
jgi:hypothetical protein